jgi:sigma-E factor negative regulatory protein RseC
MAQTRGLIVEIKKKGWAEVAINRQSACGGCESNHSCHGCLSTSKMVTSVKNPLGAVKGDMVKIHMASGDLFKGAAALYLLPVMFLLGGAGLGAAFSVQLGISETAAAILSGLLGLCLGFGLTAYISHRFQQNGRLVPKINSIIQPGQQPQKAPAASQINALPLVGS